MATLIIVASTMCGIVALERRICKMEINEWLTITLLVNIMFGALAAMVSVLVQPSSARL